MELLNPHAVSWAIAQRAGSGKAKWALMLIVAGLDPRTNITSITLADLAVDSGYRIPTLLKYLQQLYDVGITEWIEPLPGAGEDAPHQFRLVGFPI